MFSWLRHHANRSALPSPPPAWTSAPEQSHVHGRFSEAPEEDCDRAHSFCARRPVEPSRLRPSSDIETIAKEGNNAWGLEFHHTDSSFTERETFLGAIHNQSKSHSGTGVVTKVETSKACNDCCLISNLPLMGGLYYRPQEHNRGVYFELTIHKMNGVIAIGTVCRPYPHFRLPGWHRLSAALHLDDMRKFYENPDGGQESGWGAIGGRPPVAGDTIGCGYEFGTGGTLFFTFNGHRLVPNAFKGLYLGDAHDVYAAVGVYGENAFTVNFGGDFFKWLPANEWGWRLDAHVGNLSGPRALGTLVEDLPAYT
ncbi:hypothetical protein JVT61DRAFT_901 [Boletus reticuloceps]|uniref:SPRY domain-containing protein n=1 Tax=Boletus reticuloceps TaxID=495285 RepID=A0A8I2YRQ7_9AGAM|nr:hypothetical protein JVT61DRAFT_901 [Boletus reticuloceps]